MTHRDDAPPEAAQRFTRSAPRRRWLVAAILVALFAAIVGGSRTLREHARAAVLLARFADARAFAAITRWAGRPLDEEDFSVPITDGDRVRARIYIPKGISEPPAVVLAHGVHRLGIDEPRLVRFARSVAASGVAVLTPELQDLADYRIEPRTIEVLGAAAHALRERALGQRVGLMGMSFAGGLCLLAAAEPAWSDDIGFVVAVGAHDDLSRVLRFFATNAIERPDGGVVHLAAHPYGALVLAYGHAERFFDEDDEPKAREALRLWLADRRDEARERGKALTAEGRATLGELFSGDIAAVTPAIERLSEDASATSAVSPHGRLRSLRAPVFLLHGAGDSVIPSVETDWLARELAPGVLRRELVSPALVHVELDRAPTLAQSWDLVDFMSAVLQQADDDRTAR